jgi:hypothetical protein
MVFQKQTIGFLSELEFSPALFFCIFMIILSLL